MFPATPPTRPITPTTVRESYHIVRNPPPNLGPICGEREDSKQLTHCIRNTVFAGKDASRALAQLSLKPADCRPDWEDLPEKEKGVLRDWFTFFSKRYNIVGKVQT